MRSQSSSTDLQHTGVQGSVQHRCLFVSLHTLETDTEAELLEFLGVNQSMLINSNFEKMLLKWKNLAINSWLVSG